MKKKKQAKGKAKTSRKRAPSPRPVAKTGRKWSAVKDLAAKKAVKGGLPPAVRPRVSNTGVSNTGLLLPAVQKAADGSV
jgi:hypothetical protein